MAGERILVVDDDEDLVAALRAVLESAGYSVDSAGDGREARQKAKQARPDLAIVDVMMATLSDGVQLVQQFRSDPELKDMPLLMLTAVNQRFSLQLGPEGDEGYLPVDRFVEKPVDPGELLKHVEELLRG